MDYRKISFIISIAVLSVFNVGYSFSAENNRLPKVLVSQEKTLNRCSIGQLKAYRIFHVGYAALYLNDCKNSGDIFSNSNIILRFAYDREIPANAFSEAANEYLKINLGEQFQQWRQSLGNFNNAYRDIKDGDYYDLEYNPQNGLKLQLNGRLLSQISDPEIGLAYFTIWFGEQPFSKKLKTALAIYQLD